MKRHLPLIGFFSLYVMVHAVTSCSQALAGPPGKDTTTPVEDSTETDHVINADAGAGPGFTIGRDGGILADAGHRGWQDRQPVPCPTGTKLIHTLVPAGCDGGVAWGGSGVRYDDSPVIRGPGQEYSTIRSSLYGAVPHGTTCKGVLFSCGH